MKPERWVMIAGAGADAAARHARARGAEPVAVLTRQQIGTLPWRWRRAAAPYGADRAVVHSPDWDRQPAPQLLELALGAIGAPARSIADEASGRMWDVGPGRLGLAPLALVRDMGAGLAGVGAEVWRFRRAAGAAIPVAPAPADPRAVLAIWIGEPRGVGGSISHVSGILSGFRERGLRVGLLTTAEPPPQLAEVVDDVEVAAPVSSGSRLMLEPQRIADNGAIREASGRLVERLQPDFVYQRHRPFLVAGIDVAAAAGVPLVLEWNASEQWKRRHWETRGPLDRPFDGLLARMEEAALLRAALVVAVSSHAADMAIECGAPAARVITVPNAVRIDPELEGAVGTSAAQGNGAGMVGWIGSFGPWHGAEVLVTALARMGPGMRLRMIGDGTGRESCRRLAHTLGVDQRIEWTGALPHGEALLALSDCDVLASPHVPLPDRPFFGSPMKVFEYMAIGRPIVASRLEQLDEVLDDGRTAKLVAPGDPDELAAAVEAVLATPDRGASLGRAAREEALRSHTWDRRAADILDALAHA